MNDIEKNVRLAAAVQRLTERGDRNGMAQPGGPPHFLEERVRDESGERQTNEEAP